MLVVEAAAHLLAGGIANDQPIGVAGAPVGAIASSQHQAGAASRPDAHQLQLQPLLPLPAIHPEAVSHIHLAGQLSPPLPAPGHGAAV